MAPQDSKVTVKMIDNPDHVEDAYKIELDFNVPPYPYDFFYSEIATPKSYLIGCYLTHKNKTTLIGYCLFKVRDSGLYDILRIGVHYGYDLEIVGTEILEYFSKNDVQMKVRSKQTKLCELLIDNDFSLDEVRENDYKDPVDDKYIFSREALDV